MPLPMQRRPQRIPPPGAPTPYAPPAPLPAEPAPLSPPPANVTFDAGVLQDELNNLVKQIELLRQQARQSQKLAALGTTAAMMAHELNNMLTPILAYSQEALRREDQALMKQAVTKTAERGTAMQQMIQRMVNLARRPDTVIRNVPLLHVAQEAVGCVGRDLAKDGIDVHFQIDPQLQVKANDNQLLQVLFNLVLNARQAMLGKRGRLMFDAVAAETGFVDIHIRDTGCGISADHLDRVFEPFFSTRQHAERPEQRGLGLGLSICREIIEELSGSIDIASQPNVGTTVHIRLPAAD